MKETMFKVYVILLGGILISLILLLLEGHKIRKQGEEMVGIMREGFDIELVK